MKPVVNERGMTLVEMLIAVVVFGLVFVSAMTFLESQGRAFHAGSTRMDALQNFRFAADLVERELRTVGSGTADGQPFLVYTGENVVVFNADHTSRVRHNASVYHDPDAPDEATRALPREKKVTLPQTSFTYPEVTFNEKEAETIIFYFRADSSTAREDDFGLFRQVNDQKPELVSRNLLRTAGQPFFQYLRQQGDQIQDVPAGELPFRHDQATHNPGESQLSHIDRVRAVRVRFSVTNGRPGAEERVVAMTRLVRMPNSGLKPADNCGAPPLSTALSVQASELNGRPIVQVNWDPAPDEIGGQKDLRYYLLYRRAQGGDWEMYQSFPSGTHQYVDTNVESGQTWSYGIQAQDCSPKNSDRSETSAVTIP